MVLFPIACKKTRDRRSPIYPPRYQEKQAADVVSKLKGDIALKARVVRNGQEQEVKARELVPGDIVSACATPPYTPCQPSCINVWKDHRRGRHRRSG